MMPHLIHTITNIGEAAITKPMVVVISGFCTVLFSAAISTTEFASQYPGIMITIISTIGAFCLLLMGVIYRNQLNVNSEVLKGMKGLNDEIKANREQTIEEVQKLRDECRHTEERLQDKIEQAHIARAQEKNSIKETLDIVIESRKAAQEMLSTLKKIEQSKK